MSKTSVVGRVRSTTYSIVTGSQSRTSFVLPSSPVRTPAARMAARSAVRVGVADEEHHAEATLQAFERAWSGPEHFDRLLAQATGDRAEALAHEREVVTVAAEE